MPKPLDAMWLYGDAIELPNRQRLRCKLCGKESFGGINHLKYHLASISGYDVDAYLKTTLEIMRIANQSLLDMARKRDEKEDLRNELVARGQSRSMGTTSALGGGETSIPLLIYMTYNFRNPLVNLTFLCVEVTTWGATFYLVID